MKVKKTPEGWILDDEAFNTLWAGYQYEKERADDAEEYAEELRKNLEACEVRSKKQGDGFSDTEVIIVTIVAFTVGGLVTGLVIQGVK